jgi:hypothetical protein
MIVRLLIVQIKESTLQFSNPLYLPLEQKKRGVSGHINNGWRADVKWGNLRSPKKAKTLGVMQILQK